jgi:hypothetical protein
MSELETATFDGGVRAEGGGAAGTVPVTPPLVTVTDPFWVVPRLLAKVFVSDCPGLLTLVATAEELPDVGVSIVALFELLVLPPAAQAGAPAAERLGTVPAGHVTVVVPPAGTQLGVLAVLICGTVPAGHMTLIVDVAGVTGILASEFRDEFPVKPFESFVEITGVGAVVT